MRFIHDNLYPLMAALVLIAATSIWFATPLPAPPQPQAPVSEPWNLPKLAEHDSKKSTDAINARNLWGVVGTAADAIKEPEWHILGIARSGADRFILLAFDGKPVEMLKAGDTLPDGIKIVQIEKDRFFVMTPDKKKLAFGIYKNDPAK
ncbi:MAG: hypothetical protein CO065_02055 [Comamonadaceae bacterium CG_4_9_14_0_8_um_filter_57_21]|nr:MAG: hypothetical protein CO065_02055 [Comamonadaceae bacterium CG_4_9_14_0_8_um_filter_57_21]